MTPFEVFMTYVKLRGAMPTLHKLSARIRSVYLFDVDEGRYKMKPARFKDIFDNHFRNHGFGNTIFLNILYQYPDGDSFLESPEVNKAHKRWTTFVNNNVILDGNIRVGNKVKYKFWGVEHTGVIVYINKDFSRVKIRRDSDDIRMPFYDHVSPGSILESEGEPADISFHIKWKGKEYGIK